MASTLGMKQLDEPRRMILLTPSHRSIFDLILVQPASIWEQTVLMRTQYLFLPYGDALQYVTLEISPKIPLLRDKKDTAERSLQFAIGKQQGCDYDNHPPDSNTYLQNIE